MFQNANTAGRARGSAHTYTFWCTSCSYYFLTREKGAGDCMRCCVSRTCVAAARAVPEAPQEQGGIARVPWEQGGIALCRARRYGGTGGASRGINIANEYVCPPVARSKCMRMLH